MRKNRLSEIEKLIIRVITEHYPISTNEILRDLEKKHQIITTSRIVNYNIKNLCTHNFIDRKIDLFDTRQYLYFPLKFEEENS